jgi:adenosylcobinamide kinase/adenosylcobinamide-phosphate guanylyltransferase
MANQKSTKHKTLLNKLFPIFIIGGARSGKSQFALKFAEENFCFPLYIATAEALDKEMETRIIQHRKVRSKKWRTLEEPLDILKAIKKAPAKTDGILIDCITLWVSNCLLKEGKEAFFCRLTRFADFLSSASVPIMMVSNEVGMGIVPENKLAREFRDIAGTCNQKLAEVASSVIFTIAGQPLPLKLGRESCIKKIFADMASSLLLQPF